MIDKRIDKLDSILQHCDSSDFASSDLDSSLRTSCFAQNDEIFAIRVPPLVIARKCEALTKQSKSQDFER